MPSFTLVGIVQHPYIALKQSIKGLYNLKLKAGGVCTMSK